jgi:hypothetical protein
MIRPVAEHTQQEVSSLAAEASRSASRAPGPTPHEPAPLTEQRACPLARRDMID